jgi:hypothetical protein
MRKKAEQSRKDTEKALNTVESQKREVEESLSRAEVAERLARAEEETGRRLLYTTDMRLAPFLGTIQESVMKSLHQRGLRKQWQAK